MLLALVQDKKIKMAVDGTIAYHYAGLPMSSSDALVVTETGDIAYYGNGLPFTASGAVRVSRTGAVDHFANGLPFIASGALAISVSDASNVSGGDPFSATGRVSGMDTVGDGFVSAALRMGEGSALRMGEGKSLRMQA